MFSGNMPTSAPARVLNVANGVDYLYVSNDENEVIGKLSFSVLPPHKDSTSTGPSKFILVTRQKAFGSPLTFPGWRSILRKFISHLQVIERRAPGRIQTKLTYISLHGRRTQAGVI